MRTLIAAIESASQIEQNCKYNPRPHMLKLFPVTNMSDDAYKDESIVNSIYYWVLGLVGLGVIGFDIHTIIMSLGAFFMGVGFVIGNACSKFLEVSIEEFHYDLMHFGSFLTVKLPCRGC